MNRPLRLAIVVLVVAVLVGCASAPPPPTAAHPALLVGQLDLLLTGFKKYGPASVNGDQKANVEITLKNVATGALTVVTTRGPNGIFYTANLSPGEYGIEQLFFQRNDNRAYANVTLVPGARYQFRLQKEGVTNVGTLSASYDVSGRNSFSPSNGYDTVKREFLETFSRSPWSTATWNEVGLYPYSG